MRGRRPWPVEDDGLQSDVMRFMAIIAFCLVAILALVREAEPEVVTAAAMDTNATPTAAEAVTAASPDPLAVTRREPEPLPDLERSIRSEGSGETDAVETRDDGMVLRFASDSDFLRLVTSGRLEVFAFSDDGAWRLDPGLTLQAASARGALHELLPSTLPAAMLEALTGEHGKVVHYRWGMRMPARVEAQIQNHLRSARSGALIIDRNGDVRHETDD